jgi:general stress protein 26
MPLRTLASLLALGAGLAWSAPSGTPRAAPAAAATDRARVVAAARDVMQKARFCTMVTLGRDGHPQARVVDPFAPEGELTVWIATRPVTRKVREIERDGRVTLLYFDASAQAYVTVLGRADIVRDRAEKARRWKAEWKAFYADENRGEDYLLIRVRPLRLEILSPGHGLSNDPKTWQPVAVEWNESR